MPFFTKWRTKNQEEPSENQGRSSILGSIWEGMVNRAYEMIDRPLSILATIKEVLAYVQSFETLQDFRRELFDKVNVLSRLVRAYIQKDYQDLSLKHLALALAGLLYVLSPIDLVPDFLLGGFLDDALILSWVVQTLQTELELFLVWEDEQKIRLELPPKEEEQQD